MILAGALAACTTDDIVGRDTPNQLAAESAITLCAVYYDDHDLKVKGELVRRKLIPDQDWPIIDRHEVAVGMYDFEAIAAWGRPDLVHTLVTRKGTKSRYVYNACRGCQKSYLTFDNDGVLTTIQN
jgi:hypothetical protein